MVDRKHINSCRSQPCRLGHCTDAQCLPGIQTFSCLAWGSNLFDYDHRRLVTLCIIISLQSQLLMRKLSSHLHFNESRWRATVSSHSKTLHTEQTIKVTSYSIPPILKTYYCTKPPKRLATVYSIKQIISVGAGYKNKRKHCIDAVWILYIQFFVASVGIFPTIKFECLSLLSQTLMFALDPQSQQEQLEWIMTRVCSNSHVCLGTKECHKQGTVDC